MNAGKPRQRTARRQYSSWLAPALSAEDRLPREILPRVGTTLANGRFELRRVLGQGGMGVVYAAFDREFGLEIALKMLRFADPLAIPRLKQEFRVLADVVHPNLVGLQELFASGDMCFFTMDLVNGRSCVDYVFDSDVSEFQDSKIVRQGSIDPREVEPERRVEANTLIGDPIRIQSVLRQLLLGVDAIHRSGKLHRDLKPSNVLVTDQGRVVILDFDLACDRVQVSAFAEAICGTPIYMSPEQAAGREAGPASDMYAIGVILYEALCGAPPFVGNPMQVMLKKQIHDPLPPSQVRADTDAALGELCMALLRRDPESRPTISEVMRSLGVRAEQLIVQSGWRYGVTFLGRASELSEMHAAFSRSCNVRPVVLWLTGAAGAGKTSLLSVFANELREVAPRALVLTGRCYERESVPHKALDAIMEALSAYLQQEWPRGGALPDEHDWVALARLFPAMSRLPDVTRQRETSAADPRELRRRGYQALAALLSRVTQEQPLVLLIDDLHWSDSDSLQVLSALIRRGVPNLLLVLSARAGEESDVCRPLLREARGCDAIEFRELSVGNLQEDAARKVAGSLLGSANDDSVTIATICREAGGNPLWLSELARHALERRLAADAPGVSNLSLGDAVRARIQGLEPAARLMFELFCVAGHPLTQRVALTACGRLSSELVPTAESLRYLRERGLLRSRISHGPGSVAVYHDRVRELVNAEVASPRRRELHRALAAALEQVSDSDPDHIARHYLDAGETERASVYAERAGDRASRSLAFNRAAQLYRMALECVGTDASAQHRLELKLAQALSDGGHGAEAAPLLMRVARVSEPAVALDLRRQAAEQWLVSGRTSEGLAALSDVLREVGLRLPQTPRGALFDLLTTRVRLKARGLKFTQRSADDVPAEELLRIDACKASRALAFISTIRGAAFQARHLLYALQAGEPSRVALGLGLEAVYASFDGDRSADRVERLLNAAASLRDQLADPHLDALMHLAEGQSSYLLGKWESCSRALEQADAILTKRCRNVTYELNTSRFFWGNSLVFRGRWRELSGRLEGWLEDARERGDLYATSSLLLMRSRAVTLARGDVHRVREDITSAMNMWSSDEFGVQRFLAVVTQVQAALYEGSVDEAVSRMDALWPEFASSMMSRIQLCRVHASHHAGYVALAKAQTGKKRRHWLNRARLYARALRQENVTWGHAFATQIDAGIAHLSGQRNSAIKGLQSASSQFDAVHMHFYAASSRRRLGELLGGSRGQHLASESDALLRDQGVVAPEDFARMMAPGFDAI